MKLLLLVSAFALLTLPALAVPVTFTVGGSTFSTTIANIQSSETATAQKAIVAPAPVN